MGCVIYMIAFGIFGFVMGIAVALNNKE